MLLVSIKCVLLNCLGGCLKYQEISPALAQKEVEPLDRGSRKLQYKIGRLSYGSRCRYFKYSTYQCKITFLFFIKLH